MITQYTKDLEAELVKRTEERDDARKSLQQIRDLCLAAPPKDLGGILSLCLQGLMEEHSEGV